MGKYCQEESFLSIQHKCSESHGWRGILIGRDLIVKNSGWLVGNGQNISLWKDKWLDFSQPIRLLGPATEITEDFKVSALFNPGTTDWNSERIQEICPVFKNKILKIKPSNSGAPDKLMWFGTKTGDYTVKSGYNAAIANTEELEDMSTRFSWEKNVWELSTSPKIKMLVWKALKGALPVGTRLEERHVATDPRCKRCGHPESIIHLFFQCVFAKKMWQDAPFIGEVEFRGMIDLNGLWSLVKTRICLPPTGIVTTHLAPWILWEIWNARNKLVFDGKIASVEDTLTKAIYQAREWQLGQEAPKMEKKKKPVQTRSHQVSYPVVRSDAAWSATSHAALLGVGLKVSSPLMAEALALREGLEMCRRMDFKKIGCETDSLQLINSIKKGNNIPEIYGVVSDMLNLAYQFENISFEWIPRDKNREADELAKNSLFVNEDLVSSISF